MHSDVAISSHPLWSKVRMGSNVRIGQMVRLYGDPSRLTLGDNAVIDDLAFILVLGHVYIGNGVEIGPHVSIQAYAGVTINDNAFVMAGARLVTRHQRSGPGGKRGQAPIVIGSYSVIGPNAVILPGAIINANADVAANGVEQ